VLTEVSGSQRVGISVVLAMFVIGLPLMLWVDKQEGLTAAAQEIEEAVAPNG